MLLSLVIAISKWSAKTLCALSIVKKNASAIATLDRLNDRGNGRTADETEYLLALAVFVEKYEEEHHPIPPVSGVDMLRYLIETRQKTQREVAAGAGLADSTISEILAGKRKLSVKQVEALARFFKVKAAIFLDG